MKDPIILDEFRIDLCGPIADEATRLALAAKRGAPSLNRGGWKSDDLGTWPLAQACDLLVALRQEISAWSDWPHPREARVEAWAMVNWRGSHHPSHNHRSATWSGVYFLRAGDESSPPTIFEPDGPRRSWRHHARPELHVAPAAGRLVVFPADLYHRVPPYHGNEPRITVAFDVK